MYSLHFLIYSNANFYTKNHANWAPLADPSATRPTDGPIIFIFKQFSAKILPNSRFWYKFTGLRPPPRPRLGNL